jgi:hypothetical protein
VAQAGIVGEAGICNGLRKLTLIGSSIRDTF